MHFNLIDPFLTTCRSMLLFLVIMKFIYSDKQLHKKSFLGFRKHMIGLV